MQSEVDVLLGKRSLCREGGGESASAGFKATATAFKTSEDRRRVDTLRENGTKKGRRERYGSCGHDTLWRKVMSQPR